MASHAHSTRTPLLRRATGSAELLRASLPGGRIVAAGGPVTRALAVMTAADPGLIRIRTLRRSIAEHIEADIALLDALAGDTDLEDGADGEPSFCGLDVEHPSCGGDDREGVNEDGGDIQDEPHDAEEDKGAEEDEGPPSYYHRDRLMAPMTAATRQELQEMLRRHGKQLAPAGHGSVTLIGPCGSSFQVTSL